MKLLKFRTDANGQETFARQPSDNVGSLNLAASVAQGLVPPASANFGIFSAETNTYAFLDVATEELKSIALTMTFSTDEFREIIQHQSYNDRVRLTWVIHLIADSLMVFAIWYDKLWSKIRD